jgi:hypothetical protein
MVERDAKMLGRRYGIELGRLILFICIAVQVGTSLSGASFLRGSVTDLGLGPHGNTAGPNCIPALQRGLPATRKYVHNLYGQSHDPPMMSTAIRRLSTTHRHRQLLRTFCFAPSLVIYTLSIILLGNLPKFLKSKVEFGKFH